MKENNKKGWRKKGSEKSFAEKIIKKQEDKIKNDYIPSENIVETDAGKKSEKKRVTKISRAALSWALEGQPTKIKIALDKLFDESPEAYISAITKLLNYTVPKLASNEITDNSTRKIKIELGDDVSIEDLVKKLNDIGEE